MQDGYNTDADTEGASGESHTVYRRGSGRKQPATRKESVNSSEITEFVTVGRLDAWRGFDLVIEAMALFVKENQRIHLTIIGKGADEQRLKTLIARYGLEPYVTMAGKVDMDTYLNI